MSFDKVRFEGSLGNSDTYVTGRYFFTNIGKIFARLLLPTPITPNQLTWFWGGLMVVSALLYATGDYILGIIGGAVWIVAYGLDYSDGIIARYKDLKSARGKFLDMVIHRLTYPLLMFCIGYGVYRSPDLFSSYFDCIPATLYIILGVAAGISMNLFMDAAPLYEKYKVGDKTFEDNRGSSGVEGKVFKNQKIFEFLMNFNPLVFTNMMLMLLVFAIFDAMSLFIVIYGLGYSLATSARILLLYRDL